MKKYVLSAVVTGLLVVPSAYAMDGGAAPAVEIEVPAVEVEVTTEDVAVDTGAVDDVKLDAVDAVVDVEVLDTPVDPDHIRFLGPPEQAPGVDELVTEVPEGAVENEYLADGEATLTESELYDLASQSGVAVDENGEPMNGEVYFCPDGLTGDLDESGNPLVTTCEIVCPADGEGEEFMKGDCEVVDLNEFERPSDNVGIVNENGDPVVMFSFGTSEGGELPLAAGGPIEGEAVDPNAEELAAQSGLGVDDQGNSNEVPIRSLENIQPNFRGGVTDRGGEALAASSTGDESDAPNPQLLNDEQRGAVRGFRSDEESAKPRSGLGKLFSKFRKPKSEVTLASATTTDKTLSAKLAEIDRMRDTALRTGDQKALAKADKAEKALRAQAGKARKIPTRTK